MDQSSISVSFIFLITSVLYLFPMNPFFPLDRRLIGLMASCLCAVSQYCLRDPMTSNALTFIDYNVLIILVSLMIINSILVHQKIFQRILTLLQYSIKNDFNKGFWLVCLLSFVLSPLLMNDGVCLLLVDPVLDSFIPILPKTNAKPNASNCINVNADTVYTSNTDNDLNIPHDHRTNRFYLLLGLVCSANIGSVVTYCGNPQNIIISESLVSSNDEPLLYGYQFFGFMIFPAIISWIITVAVINYFRIITVSIPTNFDHITERVVSDNIHNNDNSSSILSKDIGSNQLLAFSWFSVLIYFQFSSSVSLTAAYAIIAIAMPVSIILWHYYYNMYKSRFGSIIATSNYQPYTSISTETERDEVDPDIELTHSHEDTGMSHDSSLVEPDKDILSKINSYIERLLDDIDYNLIIIFIGLFVVSGYFVTTGIPAKLW
jgi:Na+/H+ antiporter NhaD/arsenite permease-like protein